MSRQSSRAARRWHTTSPLLQVDDLGACGWTAMGSRQVASCHWIAHHLHAAPPGRRLGGLLARKGTEQCKWVGPFSEKHTTSLMLLVDDLGACTGQGRQKQSCRTHTVRRRSAWCFASRQTFGAGVQQQSCKPSPTPPPTPAHLPLLGCCRRLCRRLLLQQRIQAKRICLHIC